MSRPAVILAVMSVLLLSWNESTSVPAMPLPAGQSSVTPVEGPSWLKHLGVALASTRLGQNGGTGRGEAEGREPDLNVHQPGKALGQQFALTGADLYRLDCRSCHGPDGQGAPPEINSLIGPVQGASADLIQRRMQERGAPISKEMAEQMAQEAEKSIRDRLQHGGKKMPDFRFLQPDEVAALLSYLDRLTGTPGSPRTEVVHESAAHVGEDLVKGTCHICHSATGPGGSRMTVMMRGIIPSLATLPYDHSLESVLDQVHNGTMGGMGMGMMMMRGNRMPALPYFTDQEITAAYLYLQDYRPPR